MARAMQRRCCWPPDRPVPGSLQAVLHLVPQPGPPQALLDDLVESALVRRKPMDARAVGDVLVDRSSETGWASGTPCRRGHAAATTSSVAVVDVLPVDLDRAGHARDRDGVVHAVDAAQEGRLAAARGADEGGHGAFRDVDATRRTAPACRRRRRLRRESTILVGPGCAFACGVAAAALDVRHRHYRLNS